MYQIEDVKQIIGAIASAIHENRDYLGELDGRSGDGDLGLSMESAFDAVQAVADAYAGDSIAELLAKAALSCNKAAPSTMGTLLSAGMLSVAKAIKGKDALSDEDVVRVPRAFAEAIAARGKAKPGDKTILDALFPLADTFESEYLQSRSLQKAFASAAVAARTAAEATAGMQARIGRAKWLGERAAVHPDAGAMLCAVVAGALASRQIEPA